MDTPTELHCYRPNPRAKLSSRDRAVLQVLLDAKGVFMRDGFEVSTIAAQLKMRGRKVHARNLMAALERLQSFGLAERVATTKGAWRAVR